MELEFTYESKILETKVEVCLSGDTKEDHHYDTPLGPSPTFIYFKIDKIHSITSEAGEDILSKWNILHDEIWDEIHERI